MSERSYLLIYAAETRALLSCKQIDVSLRLFRLLRPFQGHNPSQLHQDKYSCEYFCIRPHGSDIMSVCSYLPKCAMKTREYVTKIPRPLLPISKALSFISMLELIQHVLFWYPIQMYLNFRVAILN